MNKNSYSKIINFMENTDDLVSPKITEFVNAIPKELLAKFNDKELVSANIVDNHSVWNIRKSNEKIAITYKNQVVDYENNYVGKINLEINSTDKQLNEISNKKVAEFSYEIYKGFDCVRSIDADFMIKKIAHNNFNCKYEVEIFGNQAVALKESICQESIEL